MAFGWRRYGVEGCRRFFAVAQLFAGGFGNADVIGRNVETARHPANSPYRGEGQRGQREREKIFPQRVVVVTGR